MGLCRTFHLNQPISHPNWAKLNWRIGLRVHLVFPSDLTRNRRFQLSHLQSHFLPLSETVIYPSTESAMQSPCLHLCKNYNISLRSHLPTATTQLSCPSHTVYLPISKRPVPQCQSKPDGGSRTQRGIAKVKGKKENVWSADNEMAKTSSKEKKETKRRTRQRRRRGKVNESDQVFVSGAMLVETETVLQTQVSCYRRFRVGFIYFTTELCGNLRILVPCFPGSIFIITV